MVEYSMEVLRGLNLLSFVLPPSIRFHVTTVVPGSWSTNGTNYLNWEYFTAPGTGTDSEFSTVGTTRTNEYKYSSD